MQPSSRFIQLSALALGITGALAFANVEATGFQLREQSIKNLGRANAGSVVGHRDASVVSLNPAAMTSLDKNTFQADITVIDLDAEFSGGGSTLAGTPLARPISGGNGGDPGDKTIVPNMAAVFPLHGALEGMTVGASIGAPFGLKTEYEPGWVGRYHALTSDLKTVDLTLSAALKSDEGISFGIGLIYERAEAELSKAIDFGTVICTNSGNPLNCVNPAFPFRAGSHDGEIGVTGDSTGFGWIIGAQIEHEQLAIGVSYRSEIDHDLEGNVDFQRPPGVAANPLLAATFANSAGGAPLTTPSIATLSVRYAVSDRIRVLADVQQTGWESLDTIEIRRTDGTVVGSEEFDWQDSTFVSLGAEFDLSEAFTLRAGIAKDQSPTNDRTRSPRLPDDDRMLYSLGMTWNVSDSLSVDAAYQRITIDDPTINIVSPTGSSLAGTFSGAADLVGIAAQYRF